MGNVDGLMDRKVLTENQTSGTCIMQWTWMDGWERLMSLLHKQDLKEHSREVLAQESADFTQGPLMSSCKHFWS